MKLKELLAKATPGPWNTGMECTNSVSLITDDDRLICDVIADEDLSEEDTANAELITYFRNQAEAYVALHEAARDVTQFFVFLESCTPPHLESGARESLNNLRRALKGLEE